MPKVVKPRARTRLDRDPEAWDIVMSFDFKTISKDIPLTKKAIDRWKTSKGLLNYVTFRTLKLTDIKSILSAAKRAEVTLQIDRWGRIAFYKILLQCRRCI